MTLLTPAMKRALRRAAARERGNICPTASHANAQTMLIKALDRRGYIVWDRPEGLEINGKLIKPWGAPRISEAGRAAIAREDAT